MMFPVKFPDRKFIRVSTGFFAIIFLAVPLCTGCGKLIESPAPQITPKPAIILPSPTIFKVSTNIPVSPVSTSSPISTGVSQTATPVNLPNSTTPSTYDFQKNCLTVEDHLPGDVSLPGYLILNNNKTWITTFFELQKNRRHLSPLSPKVLYINHPENISISPNGKWIAYLESIIDESGYRTSGLKLGVMDVEGRRLDLSYWTINNQSLIGWLDTQRLVLSIPGYPIGTITILNPFNGKTQFVNSNFPNLYRKLYWEFPNQVLYNQALSDAVYYDSSRKWALFDLDTRKILWRSDETYDNIPIWSPDGTMVAIYGNFETIDHDTLGQLLIVGQDGQLISATGITQIDSFTFKNFSWSPNSQYIAAWMMLNPNKNDSVTNKNLVLMDVEKRQLAYLCIESEYTYYYPFIPPVWSPDNQFVAISVERKDNFAWDTVIIDITHNRAYKMFEYEIPIAWMVK